MSGRLTRRRPGSCCSLLVARRSVVRSESAERVAEKVPSRCRSGRIRAGPGRERVVSAHVTGGTGGARRTGPAVTSAPCVTCSAPAGPPPSCRGSPRSPSAPRDYTSSRHSGPAGSSRPISVRRTQRSGQTTLLWLRVLDRSGIRISQVPLLVIVPTGLLSDDTAQFHDLGPDCSTHASVGRRNRPER